MDSVQLQASNGGRLMEKDEEMSNNVDNNRYASMVDPFLVEALQNPRHRLTILRMELVIQKFLLNPEQLQFEFQHFPTSYLRLAAHRVAQHYGLQTMVLDNLVDGAATKIVARKTTDSKYPSVRLSDIPAKQSENSKHEPFKIAIRPKTCSTSSGDASDMGSKGSLVRSVEERMEEYDRARARIFSSPSTPSSEDLVSPISANGNGLCPSKHEDQSCRNLVNDPERASSVRDVETSSRVAVVRDREKDHADPDYDRSYDRYVKNIPASQSFLSPFNVPNFQTSFVHYDAPFPQMSLMPGMQTSVNYGPSSDPSMPHYCTMGSDQTSRDAIYVQWPSPAMIYAHSYGPFRQSVLQVPLCQQPLSFDYSQNH